MRDNYISNFNLQLQNCCGTSYKFTYFGRTNKYIENKRYKLPPLMKYYINIQFTNYAAHLFLCICNSSKLIIVKIPVLFLGTYSGRTSSFLNHD